MEVYSIDEAFLELTGFTAEAHDATRRAYPPNREGLDRHPGECRHRPDQDAGKGRQSRGEEDPPGGGVWSLITVASQHEPVTQLPVADVWGIGRQWSKLLEFEGITILLGFQPPAGELDQEAAQCCRPAYGPGVARYPPAYRWSWHCLAV